MSRLQKKFIVLILPNSRVFSFTIDNNNAKFLVRLFQHESIFNPFKDTSSYIENFIKIEKKSGSILSFEETVLPSLENSYHHFNPDISTKPIMHSSHVHLIDFNAKVMLSFKEEYINLEDIKEITIHNEVNAPITSQSLSRVQNILYLLEHNLFQNDDSREKSLEFKNKMILALRQKLENNSLKLDSTFHLQKDYNDTFTLKSDWRIKHFYNYPDTNPSGIPFLEPNVPMMYDIVEHLINYGFNYKVEYLEEIKNLALRWSNGDELLDTSRLDKFAQSFTTVQEKIRLESHILPSSLDSQNERLSNKI